MLNLYISVFLILGWSAINTGISMHSNIILLLYYARTFSTAVAQLWNTIPEYIKNAESVATFKTKLETFLFEEYFY